MKASFENSVKFLVDLHNNGHLQPQYNTTCTIGHLVRQGMGYKQFLLEPENILQLLMMGRNRVPAWLDKDGNRLGPKWVEVIRIQHTVDNTGQKATPTHNHARLTVSAEINMSEYNKNGVAKAQLDSTGYNLLELAEIGQAFETDFFTTIYGESPDRSDVYTATFNGMLGVMGALGRIHKVSDDRIEDARNALIKYRG